MPAPPANPPSAPRLDYDRAGGPFASRRGMRLLTGLTVLNTALLVAVLLGVQPGPLVRGQWQKWQAARAAARYEKAQLAAQQQCLDFALPADRVVYEEDPAAIARLLASPGGGYVSSIRDRPRLPSAPADWQEPVRLADPDFVSKFGPTAGHPESGSALVFLHTRTPPSGQQRLVMVRFASEHTFRTYPDYPGARSFGGGGYPGTATDRGPAAAPTRRWTTGPSQSKLRGLVAQVTPATPGHPASSQYTTRLLLRLPDDVIEQPALASASYFTSTRPATAPAVPFNYGNLLRVYAGQPDAADPAHFTIAYELDGTKGVIDGYVGNDDRVTLRPREGAQAVDAPDAWELTGTTTQPATAPNHAGS